MKKSNCLLVALKHWLKHPLTTRIGFMWCGTPHFYWRYKNQYWHFCAHDKNLPLIQIIWFEGTIERM